MWVALLCANLCLGQFGPDDVRHPKLKAGIEKYEALDYEGSQKILRRLLKSKKLKGKNRSIALAYLARVHAILGRFEPAKRSFEQLLRLEPTFDVSTEESPRIRDALAAARASVPESSPPPTDEETNELLDSLSMGGSGATDDGNQQSSGGTDPITEENGSNVEEIKATQTVDTNPMLMEPPSIKAEDDTPVNWVLWGSIAGGAVVLGVIIAIVASSGDDEVQPNAVWQLP
jgi:tetratricopeptide (TPR) repeat protein